MTGGATHAVGNLGVLTRREIADRLARDRRLPRRVRVPGHGSHRLRGHVLRLLPIMPRIGGAHQFAVGRRAPCSSTRPTSRRATAICASSCSTTTGSPGSRTPGCAPGSAVDPRRDPVQYASSTTSRPALVGRMSDPRTLPTGRRFAAARPSPGGDHSHVRTVGRRRRGLRRPHERRGPRAARARGPLHRDRPGRLAIACGGARCRSSNPAWPRRCRRTTPGPLRRGPRRGPRGVPAVLRGRRHPDERDRPGRPAGAVWSVIDSLYWPGPGGRDESTCPQAPASSAAAASMPGDDRRVEFVSYPEFLRESTGPLGLPNPDRVVIGDGRSWAGDAVAELYRRSRPPSTSSART